MTWKSFFESKEGEKVKIAEVSRSRSRQRDEKRRKDVCAQRAEPAEIFFE